MKHKIFTGNFLMRQDESCRYIDRFKYFKSIEIYHDDSIDVTQNGDDVIIDRRSITNKVRFIYIEKLYEGNIGIILVQKSVFKEFLEKEKLGKVDV